MQTVFLTAVAVYIVFIICFIPVWALVGDSGYDNKVDPNLVMGGFVLAFETFLVFLLNRWFGWSPTTLFILLLVNWNFIIISLAIGANWVLNAVGWQVNEDKLAMSCAVCYVALVAAGMMWSFC